VLQLHGCLLKQAPSALACDAVEIILHLQRLVLALEHLTIIVCGVGVGRGSDHPHFEALLKLNLIQKLRRLLNAHALLHDGLLRRIQRGELDVGHCAHDQGKDHDCAECAGQLCFDGKSHGRPLGSGS
jgi:hypothetical protein